MMNNGSMVNVNVFITTGDVKILNAVLQAIKNNRKVDEYLLQDFEAIVRDFNEQNEQKVEKAFDKL